MALKIGTNLTIEIEKNETVEKYNSKVMDLNDSIFISYPTHVQTNKTVFLLNDAEIKVVFEENGQVYYFISSVIGRINNSIPLIKIRKPFDSEIKQIQRREFVRINRAVDVAVHFPNGEMPPFTTVTSDISAGGSSIIVPKEMKLEKEQILLCMFVFPRNSGANQYVKLNCKVVRIQENNARTNIASLQFLEKTNVQEQQIIQFCFESELSLKQKEINF